MRGGMGGGFGGGGMRGGMGGGFGGGGMRGGMRGGFGGGGFRGGFGGGGFRGGFGGFNRGFGFRGNRFFFNRGFGFRGPFIGAGYWGWPGWGWGVGWGGGYWPDGYGSSPNVTVVYASPQPAAAPVYVEQGSPVIREYDEYGQPVGPSRGLGASAGSPIYLIALKDHTIYPAVAYSVQVDTLLFVTIWNEQKRAPLNLIDRGLSIQLNRERHVNFQLP
jgi:hypothetical protein